MKCIMTLAKKVAWNKLLWQARSLKMNVQIPGQSGVNNGFKIHCSDQIKGKWPGKLKQIYIRVWTIKIQKQMQKQVL